MLLFLLFVALKNGVYIDSFSLNHLKIKKLYIKWDEKIDLHAKEIIFATTNKKFEPNYNNIVKEVKNALVYTPYFYSIAIDNIIYDDLNTSLKYTQDENSTLNIDSTLFQLSSSIKTNGEIFDITIDNFLAKKENIKANARVVFDLSKKIEAIAKAQVYIGETKFQLNLSTDTDKLSYLILCDNEIKNKKEIVDLFSFDKDVRYWVDDAIDMSGLNLKYISGWLEYKNIDKAYLNLRAKGVANRLIYTYDQKLEPINSAYTDLEFKDGVLYIMPKKAYTYGFDLNKSYLKIDFSKKEEILSLYLLFNSQVNSDILNLLEHYGIKLPFIQTQGTLDTDLNLLINLRTLGVDAKGIFNTKKAQIHYLGLDIDVFDVNVKLNNTYAQVDNMYAKYGDIASGYVDINYNASKSSGMLNFDIDNFKLDKYNLKFNDKNLNASYNITPSGDFITLSKSAWLVDNLEIHIDPIKKIPFNIQTLKADIDPTYIEIKDIASAVVEGELNLKDEKGRVDVKLTSLKKSDVELYNKENRFSLVYDNDIVIKASNPILLNIFDKKCSVDNLYMKITKEDVDVKNTHIKIGDVVDAKLNAIYNFNTSKGTLDIYDLSLYDSFLKNRDDLKIIVKNNKDETKISIPQYDIESKIDKNGFFADIASPKKIVGDIESLKKYDFNSSHLIIEKKKTSEDISFTTQIKDSYKILTKENEIIEKYDIEGRYNTKTKNSTLTINDSVKINISDDIYVNAHNIGFNLDEILDLLKDDENETKKDDSSTKNIYLSAYDCYFYLSQNRFFISDKIDLKYKNKVLDIKLNHKDAEAKLQLKDDKFYFFGDNFGDEFMSKLFAMSKFRGGVLRFSMSGAVKDFEGILYVENTTVLDYKILNNILAFVNTVPSLVTFSLPGYNIRGLPTQNAYIKFKYKDDLYKLSDVYLKSKEIEIKGYGEASVANNSIDMELNLKSDLGSSFSKIPLIGNLIMGNESLSTTLKVDGKLEDPQVHTQLTKDIVVAPLHIIKRALMYPFEIFRKEDE